MGDLISRSELVAAINRQYCTGCDNYNGSRCRACHADDMLSLVDDAADAMPRWISVKEKLPEHMDDVLVWVGGLAEIGCHDENNDCWELYTYVGDGSVTHWMPLPEPPKEE